MHVLNKSSLVYSQTPLSSGTCGRVCTYCNEPSDYTEVSDNICTHDMHTCNTYTGKGLLQQCNPQEITHCAGISRHAEFRWRSLSPTTFAAHPLTALNSLTKPRSLLWSQKRQKGRLALHFMIHASNGLYFYTGAEVPNLSTMLYLCESSAPSLLHHFHKLLVAELTIIYSAQCKTYKAEWWRMMSKPQRRDRTKNGDTAVVIVSLINIILQ